MRIFFKTQMILVALILVASPSALAGREFLPKLGCNGVFSKFYFSAYEFVFNSRNKIAYDLPLLEGITNIPPSPRRANLDMSFSPENKAFIYGKIGEMAEQGYELRTWQYVKGQLVLNFKYRRELIPKSMRAPEPIWVAKQRAKLKEAFPARVDTLHPTVRGPEASQYTAQTEEKYILTAKNFNSVKPDLYAFVRLKGENFLRIGVNHPTAGAGAEAQAAGDIRIERNPATGLNEIAYMSPRSGAYGYPKYPHPSTLANAVEALWRQDIYPEKLLLKTWDLNETILDLSLSALDDPMSSELRMAQ